MARGDDAGGIWGARSWRTSDRRSGDRTAGRGMTDNAAIQSRVNQYLSEAGLTSRSPRVVPLTGDASDRRYFRVLFRDAPSQVLAVHPQAIEFERLPFANVARLMSSMPVPVPA